MITVLINWLTSSRLCCRTIKGVAGQKEDWLLIGMPFEVSVINAEIGGRGEPILFELSINTYGNHIDGKFETPG